MHHDYMIVLSAVFAAAAVIMIHSMIRHRRASAEPRRFSGPTGSVQWLWALLPLAILAGIDVALMESPDEQRSAGAPKIELASVTQTDAAGQPGKSTPR